MKLDLRKVNSLIGKTYDPNDFHCWTLIEELIPNAPKIDFVVDSITASVKKIDSELKLNESLFEFPTKPEDGDIILFALKSSYLHVGIYWKNVIIHNSEFGVRTEAYKVLLNKYKKTKILRVRD